MAMRLVRQPATVAALLLLLVRPSDLASCGPFFRMAEFSRVSFPENEKAFFSGQLGILQPTYWRRYLAMSYRILQGIPLTASELASIGPARLPGVNTPPATSAVEKWSQARQQVPGTQPVKIEQFHDGSDFTRYLNCGDDAFFTAIATLNDRIRLAGAASAEVRGWLSAQDLVFSNCGAKADAPAPAPPGSSARIVADRDYQIAAAHFYAGSFSQAKEMFQKIAADAASPWHTIAPYLAARADIRKGGFATAQSELQAILADPKLASIHAAAASLLQYVDAKTDPGKRLLVCSKRLLIPDSPTLAHDLADYTFLYDRLEPIKEPQDDITTWIEQFRNGQEDDLAKRWERDHSLPWLVAAIFHASGVSSRADQLIDAARQLPFDSPGWPTVRFHAVRLLLEKGKKPEAREMLSQISGHLKDANLSTANGFHAEQMKLAENLAEYLTAAPRRLVGEGVQDMPGEEDAQLQDARLPMFDRDAEVAFDAFIPLNLRLASIHDNLLPNRLLTVLAAAGFVRAIILDSPLAPDFARVLGKLKPGYASDMNRYLAAPKEQARLTAVLWMLHHPEASPMIRGDFPRARIGDVPDGQLDSYRDNWWCAAKEPKMDDYVSPILRQLYAEGWKPPAFLTGEQLTQAANELKALANAGGGPGFLSTTILAWARAYPEDAKLPEALSLAVKSSHSSCTDENSAAPVSEAFRLLHSRFPNSSWAKQTPYWYR